METYDTCPKYNTNQKHKNKSICRQCAKPIYKQRKHGKKK